MLQYAHYLFKYTNIVSTCTVFNIARRFFFLIIPSKYKDSQKKIKHLINLVLLIILTNYFFSFTMMVSEVCGDATNTVSSLIRPPSYIPAIQLFVFSNISIKFPSIFSLFCKRKHTIKIIYHNHFYLSKQIYQ